MLITTVTVVHNAVSLDYTALTRQQKESLVAELTKQPSGSEVLIPAITTGTRQEIQNEPLRVDSVTSIAVTFV